MRFSCAPVSRYMYNVSIFNSSVLYRPAIVMKGNTFLPGLKKQEKRNNKAHLRLKNLRGPPLR